MAEVGGEPRLIGREAELARIDLALGDLENGSRILAVAGEPGIGKTRLLAELADLAEERRMLVLGGRASEPERDVPFAVLVDALDDYLASLHPRLLDQLGDEVLSEVAGVLPSVADRAPPLADRASAERFRIHRAVRTLLTALASRKPLVLTLDDLHWADDASGEVVSHLVRHPPAGRVLLALAFRPAELDEHVGADLELARREGGVELLDLEPLSAAEAGELLADAVPATSHPDLYRESGGNPFYLEELGRLATLTPDDASRSAAADGELGDVQLPSDIPRAVIDGIAAETARLSPPAGLLLQGAAVAGEQFELEVAAAAAEMGAAQSFDALDELLERELVRTTDSPRRFRFRHPIVRSAVYARSGPGWRLASHGRVADLLAERGAPPLARARHVECSASPGDEGSAAVLAEAAHAAGERAPGTAVHWYEAALRLLRDGDASRRLALLLPMARALGAVGRFEESRRLLDEVLELVPTGEVAVRAEVLGACAELDHVLGRHGDARKLMERTLGELPDRLGPRASSSRLRSPPTASSPATSRACGAGSPKRFGTPGPATSRVRPRPPPASSGAPTTWSVGCGRHGATSTRRPPCSPSFPSPSSRRACTRCCGARRPRSTWSGSRRRNASWTAPRRSRASRGGARC